jgi:hypothetical protein
MNRETVRQIINDDLGMRKISANMVPRNLTDDQKQRRLHISSDLIHNADMSDRVITGDETWCFQYDLETKRQSMQRKTQNSSLMKKACMSRSQLKIMLVFLQSRGDSKKKKDKTAPVTGHESPQECEMPRLSHLLDSGLIDGGKIVSLTRWSLTVWHLLLLHLLSTFQNIVTSTVSCI